MLGIEIKRDRANRQLFIGQNEYTETVLRRFGMEKSKPVATPMDRNNFETLNSDSETVSDVPYRQAVLTYNIISFDTPFKIPRYLYRIVTQRIS